MESIIYSTKPDINKLPGGWEPKLFDVKVTNKGNDTIFIKNLMPGAFILEEILTEYACKKLIGLMNDSPNFEAVSVQGNKEEGDNRIGSTRTTMWSPELAEGLWEIIGPTLSERAMNDTTLTDWWQDTTKFIYEPVAISPMLRFMKYIYGGQHYAHYDAGFIYPDNNYRTLQSFVIYLTTNSTGATRFINDKQTGAIWNRKHKDWTREVMPEEVICESLPVQGNVLIFDHRMCHDVSQYLGKEGDRIIIRGDIIYKATK
ncbi:MAG: 2OG-Fe(II) oxygenase [Bacteroidia bacterium]